VREVAEKSGTPFNRRSYDAEAKRAADAFARRRPAAPAPAQPKP